MAIRVVDVTDPCALGRFVELERDLIGHHRLFVSEIDAVVANQLSGCSPAFAGTHVALFVATRGEIEVARCAAIVHPRWQEWHADGRAVADARHVGFIGYFAAASDAHHEVKGMMEAAEDWLRLTHGIRRVIAPINGHALIAASALTDAFCESPMFPLRWNPCYYKDYFEHCGYSPSFPIWQYEFDFCDENYRSSKERALELTRVEVEGEEREVTVREIDKRNWDREIETFRKLFNEGFRDEWELLDHTPAEFREFWGWARDVLPSEFILFAEVEGEPEPVAFIFGFPDWTPLFRSFHGTFDHYRLRREAGDFVRAGAIGIAMREPRWKKLHIGSRLLAEFFDRMERLGLPGALAYWLNDHNKASRTGAERAGGMGRKLFHCYEKRIA